MSCSRTFNIVAVTTLPTSGAGQVTWCDFVKMVAAKRKRGRAQAAAKKKVKFVENAEKSEEGQNAAKEQEPNKEITVPLPVSQVRL